MEAATEDLRRRDLARWAWAATALAALQAVPAAPIRQLSPATASILWFLQLLDKHLTALERREPASYAAGWPLLGVALATAALNMGGTLWIQAPAGMLLLFSVVCAWRDLFRR